MTPRRAIARALRALAAQLEPPAPKAGDESTPPAATRAAPVCPAEQRPQVSPEQYAADAALMELLRAHRSLTTAFRRRWRPDGQTSDPRPVIPAA